MTWLGDAHVPAVLSFGEYESELWRAAHDSREENLSSISRSTGIYSHLVHIQHGKSQLSAHLLKVFVLIR